MQLERISSVTAGSISRVGAVGGRTEKSTRGQRNQSFEAIPEKYCISHVFPFFGKIPPPVPCHANDVSRVTVEAVESDSAVSGMTVEPAELPRLLD